MARRLNNLDVCEVLQEVYIYIEAVSLLTFRLALDRLVEGILPSWS